MPHPAINRLILGGSIPRFDLLLSAATGTVQSSAGTGAAAAADGDIVGFWADQSGNARHASQPTSGREPTLRQVTNNGVTFWVLRSDGSNDSLAGSMPASPTQALTVIWNMNITKEATNDSIYNFGSRLIRSRLTSTETVMFAGSNMFSSTQIPAAWAVITCVWAGAASVLRINGVQVAAGNPGANNGTGYRIFSDADGAGVQADIAEFAVSLSALSQSNMLITERAFGARCGVSV